MYCSNTVNSILMQVKIKPHHKLQRFYICFCAWCGREHFPLVYLAANTKSKNYSVQESGPIRDWLIVEKDRWLKYPSSGPCAKKLQQKIRKNENVSVLHQTVDFYCSALILTHLKIKIFIIISQPNSEDLSLLQEQVAVGLQTAEVGPAYRQAAEVGPAYRLETSTELATIRAELGNFPWAVRSCNMGSEFMDTIAYTMILIA